MPKRKKKHSSENGDIPNLVVASAVRTFVRDRGYNVSGELIGAVNKALTLMLKRAAGRCENNGRRTVRPHDI